MFILTALQRNFFSFSPVSSEEFTSASRGVKPGLVCCGIVSAWTWSAALLRSSTAAYTFGVSGPSAHILFTFYGFMCILIVCGSLLLRGAATNRDLRATFICDSSHTIILFISLYVFIFRSHRIFPAIGSVSALYDLSQQAAIDSPVVGNQDGSYLTLKSNQSLVFGAAIKSVPQPNFPTYPSPLSPNQASARLAPPTAAAVLMGKGGATAVLLVVFIAVTSAARAEPVGISSLFIYRAYFRLQATGEQIVRVSHYFICFWAVSMRCWASIRSAGNIDLEWVRVIPIAPTVSWPKLTRAGVFCGAIGGAWSLGQINILTLAEPYSALRSGVTGLHFSGTSLFETPGDSERSTKRGDVAPSDIEKQSNEKEISRDTDGLPEDEEQRMAPLVRVFKKALVPSSVSTLIVVIIVPLRMFFPHYVFSRKSYTFWTACTMYRMGVWTFCIVLPLWEPCREMAMIL
ncbi:hypothetical protein PAXRUDRAFT_32837 [Paxillus rubicundulus Ve08.2h10]|uniref:Uncharacterized protein n=1 Tax=Paxillus rubicundulus Ve08.2h10 TaxID=930991 RepID=A0A0D0DZ60_9AGAM|nr:hypothetical protein PAXRUDRAFT_32837 [Paxillus rubicundulus Ve08.2h10]